MDSEELLRSFEKQDRAYFATQKVKEPKDKKEQLENCLQNSRDLISLLSLSVSDKNMNLLCSAHLTNIDKLLKV